MPAPATSPAAQPPAVPHSFLKYLPIAKVEELADGTLRVYGIVTADLPDSDGEICDYETTKPHYKARADEMVKNTTIPGMEPSLMPLREMHNSIAAGKGTQLDFDDPNKIIRMGFEVVDQGSILKIKKGVLAAFSQGGNYLKRWEDPKDKSLVRYTADPIEVSLVDRGALPQAVIESIKNRQVEFVKADGSIELRKFAPEAPAPAPAATQLSLLGDADVTRIADALADSLQKKTAAARMFRGQRLPATAFALVGQPQDPATWDYPIDSPDAVLYSVRKLGRCPETSQPAVKAALLGAAKTHQLDLMAMLAKMVEQLKQLRKGMYQVSEMAQLIEQLSWLQRSSVYERDFEGDDSKQPEDLARLLESAIECFLLMADEEAKELAATALAEIRNTKGAKNMKPEDLQKAKDHAKALHGHLTKAMEAHTAMGKMHKELGATHDKMGKAHEAQAATLGKAMESAGALCEATGEKVAAAAPAPAADPAPAAGDPPVAKVDAPAPAPAAAPPTPAPASETLTRAQADEIVKAAVTEALKTALPEALKAAQLEAQDPTGKIRLAPRPGEPTRAEKAAAPDDLKQAASVGF